MLELIQETAAYLKGRMHTQPETAIILGTGLGSLATEITEKYEIKYEEIPNFPVSTVEGHSGKLIFGKLGNKDIMAMQGRFHYYEGYSMKEVTFPVRVMRELGIKTLFVSNASGGTNPDFEIGDLMIITDHINYFPEHPLRGKNIPYGPRFPDMSEAYDKELIRKANAIAAEKYIYEEEKAKKIKKELDLEKNLVIGHIGRFNPQKNHKFLIDIFEKCFEKNQKVRLMLIGDGEGRKEIENKVKERGLQDNVIFMGVRRDVPELLQAMDVFVFPSLYEGLPVTMIEEQAAGVPAVISDRVSEECIITKDLVKVEGLEETPEQWAGEILKQVKISKRDRSEEIKKAKYDVETNAKWLEEYYLRKAEVN